MRTACLAVVILAVTAGAPSARAQDRADLPAALDRFIGHALGEIEAVPGLAVAVVDDRGLVHAAGYGVADVETKAPVTRDTRFYIASSTKSFTALAIAAMEARGELDLDAPIVSWVGPSGIPADMAHAVTLTDLLTHRSGVENDAIAFRTAFSGDWTRDVLWRLTAETRANDEAPYGAFDYTNSGYNLATVLIEHRWGRDWRALVDDEVLRPLGMMQTTAMIDAVRAQGGVVAAGHFGRSPGQPGRSYLQKTDDTMQSAGGLISSADDMAIWLEAQINDGVVGGRRVFPAGLVASTHTPRVTQDATFGEYARTGYGLGWQIGRYGDDLLIHHFGNFAGSRAHVSFMPERKLGVAVLINEDAFAGELADLVANYVYDWFAGTADIETAYEARLDDLVARRDRRRAGFEAGIQSRAARPRSLTRPDADYVGAYVSDAYGTMIVRQVEGGLEVAIGVQHALAENGADPETLRVELTPLAGQIITFRLGAGGRAVELIYDGETFVRLDDQA